MKSGRNATNPANTGFLHIGNTCQRSHAYAKSPPENIGIDMIVKPLEGYSLMAQITLEDTGVFIECDE
jgi:hypothetical protein